MAGRKRKPTELHVLEGTLNSTRHSDRGNEPRPVQSEEDAPDYLSDEATEIWDELAPLLINLGVLTEIDRQLFSAYCEKRAAWEYYTSKVEKGKEVGKTKNGNLVQNPYIGLANRAFDQMIKLGIEFGITPSSRSKVKVSEKNKKGERKDRFFPRRTA